MSRLFSKIGACTLTLLVLFSLTPFLINELNADSSSASVTIITPECNDSVDNDGDLLVDYPFDAGCSSATDNDETDPAVTYQCNDGLDNDGDSRIDFSADLGCDSATDDSESGEIASSSSNNSSVGGNGPTVNSLASDNRAAVTLTGITQKGATVVILADSRIIGQSVADDTGNFNFNTDNLSAGFYIFNLYAKDASNRKSPSRAYAVYLSKGMITQLSGIALFSFESLLPGLCPPRGDLNGDCKVDLIDFSITAYWWKRNLAGSFVEFEKGKLSGDGQVTLEDFSILAYYWTG